MKATAEAAREMWRIYYPAGCCAPNSAPRIDKGLKRSLPADSQASLSGFNRKRHGANLRSQPGVSSQRDVELLADQQIQAAGSWTPAMQKEHDFQMEKVVRGAGETFVRGGALASERPLFQVIGAQHAARRAKAHHQRLLSDSRKISRNAPTEPLDFSLGGCVFVEPGCLGDVSEVAVSQTIRLNHMRRVDDPLDAAGGYIVVASPADAGRANHWIAVLSGCALVTPDYFAAAGASGSCLCWHAAVQVKRDVWISPEWQRDEPLLSNLLMWAIRLPASKWRLRDAWTSRTYVTKQGTMKTLVGVVTARQKALRACQQLPHAFAQREFIEFVAKLDAPTSGYVNAGTVPTNRDRG